VVFLTIDRCRAAFDEFHRRGLSRPTSARQRNGFVSSASLVVLSIVALSSSISRNADEMALHGQALIFACGDAFDKSFRRSLPTGRV